jgi:transposase
MMANSGGGVSPKRDAAAAYDCGPAPHPVEDAGFDAFVERVCRPYCAENMGHLGILARAYFRMLISGCFEGLDSQRRISWRGSDRRSLQAFPGYGLTERTPDHSSPTKVLQRLPPEVHEQVSPFA